MTRMIKCRTEISREFRFEAAHRLPFVTPGHKCARLHGHSFSATVTVTGPVAEKLGWVMDFDDISKIVKPIIDGELDHRYLNDIKGLENPTSEKIALWLWNKVKPHLPQLYKIVVHETCTARAELCPFP